MKSFCLFCLLILMSQYCTISAADAVSFPLKLSSGGASKLTAIRPREITLSPARPGRVKRIPSGLKAPLYGEMVLGPKEQPTVFSVLLDAPEGQPSRLYVDSNANGDLTDDPPAEWTHKTYEGREGAPLRLSVGGATLFVRSGNDRCPLHLTFSRYDTTEPARAPQFIPLTFAADYLRDGTVALGGKSYSVHLVDALSRGDFRGSGIAGQSGIFLLIDVNGNGKIDPRGETYDAFEPFNIGGITYELHVRDASGSAVEIEKSTRSVAEILPPPDLSPGKAVPAFEKTTTEGRTIRFPSDYKGKLILLYFWATWCGDCAREAPFVSKVYEQLHTRGLDVLGVSLDHPDQADQLANFTKDHNMPWPEIYDGKVWDAELAQLYFITHTPSPFLVDGDTGVVLNSGLDLEGDRLLPTVEKALQNKKAIGSTK